MKKGSTMKTIMVMLVVSIILIGVYFLISTKKGSEQANKTTSTEVEKILARDLEEEYPVTPREVIKLYSRINKCFYNEVLTDEEINDLTEQLRKLFDYELLENNPMEQHLINLKVEIKSYQDSKKTMQDYVIDQSSAVRYYEQDGDSLATIDAVYKLKDQSGKGESKERFVLRKDSDGQWKICGWKLEENVDIDLN